MSVLSEGSVIKQEEERVEGLDGSHWKGDIFSLWSPRFFQRQCHSAVEMPVSVKRVDSGLLAPLKCFTIVYIYIFISVNEVCSI